MNSSKQQMRELRRMPFILKFGGFRVQHINEVEGTS